MIKVIPDIHKINLLTERKWNIKYLQRQEILNKRHKKFPFCCYVKNFLIRIISVIAKSYRAPSEALWVFVAAPGSLHLLKTVWDLGPICLEFLEEISLSVFSLFSWVISLITHKDIKTISSVLKSNQILPIPYS